MEERTTPNSYVIADNELELVRLQLQGNVFDETLPTLPRLFQPQERARVIDLGCGPGGWALRVARKYAMYDVVGVDVNPRMIAYAEAQAEVQELDVEFRVMDVLQPFDFAESSFDFVNLRLGTSFMKRAAAGSVFRECWRVLRPGGVFRDTETVMVTVSHPAYRQMLSWIGQAFAASGLTDDAQMATSVSTVRILTEIGFHPVEVVSHVLDMSAGSILHRTMTEDMQVALPQLKPFVTEKMHICDAATFDQVAEESVREAHDPRFYAHWYMCAVCAMKP